jgi:hypothetical protein
MIIAKMTQNQAVSTDTTEESRAVVLVPPDKFKTPLLAVLQTLCGAASVGNLKDGSDSGFAHFLVGCNIDPIAHYNRPLGC